MRRNGDLRIQGAVALFMAALCALGGWLTEVPASVEDAEILNNIEQPAPEPGRLDRTPILLPASAAGWKDEVRMPWDVSSYLAFHKAAAYGREKDMLAEPTPNQNLYDVGYYLLELNINPNTHVLTGTVTVEATVVTGPLSTIELDLQSNMAVSSVTSGGLATTFSHATNILTVDLDRSYGIDETVTLVIDYSGTPVGGSFAFDSFGGQNLIWTLSEPYGARTWWPCKDYPYDKADSADIKVTVPTGLITVSNGALREQTDNGAAAFSWWHEGHPITTYLVSLAIHPYAVSNDWYIENGDSVEVVFYDFPSHVGGNQNENLLVKDMLGAFAGRFGPYPFPEEKYGHAEFTWGGGMEHQTCTSLGAYYEYIVAHEAAHQWYGDMIGPETFHHVWLNEGFATYSEALWAEDAYGEAAYFADILANQYFGGGTIYVPDLDNENRIFHSGLSYNKGSFVLHMLRHVVGDADFFEILQTYSAQFKDSVANTDDFKGVCETISGMDLDAFFQQWIYGEYFPVYKYDWSFAPVAAGYDVSLDIEQLQTSQLFTMPIDVRITTVAGEQNFVVDNSLAVENYILHVDDEPLDVALDPDHWILRFNVAPIPEPTFEKGILLVNGVDWGTYDPEIQNAYEAKAFWGDYEIDFWDWFQEPGGGYPSTLPPPRGHGAVPGDILGEYQVVIWVGNNFNGDLAGWIDSPILSYLDAGGDVLLMTRTGDSFLIDPFRTYLGITDLDGGSLLDCVAVETGFTDIGLIGNQNLNVTFDQTVGPESVLLYRAEAGYEPDRGSGVIRLPADGGEYNPEGGRFAFLSGRPYRWNHAQLQENVETILRTYFGQGSTGVEPPPPTELRFALDLAEPNPFTGETTLRFVVPERERVLLTIWDVSGRRVRVLHDDMMDAGAHGIVWDGRGASGEAAAAGVYFYRLQAGDRTAERKILRLR